MTIKRGLERLLLFKLRENRGMVRGTVERALLCGFVLAVFVAAAFAQTVESYQPLSTIPPASPTPATSLLNFDAERAAGRPSSSSGSSAAITNTISVPSGYQLGTGDQISIEVFGEDDLRTAGRLNSDGAVNLPLLGSVSLAGLTTGQAAARLTELYGRDYLVNPKVNVTLVGYAKRRFTVLGQVNRPGAYELPEGSSEGVDILEAIAMAGGYTRIAAPERISVKRRDQILRVDAKRLARSSGTKGGFRVEPGDTITVAESLF
jgi:protein involved in polysaccharide export with SLBB domain